MKKGLGDADAEESTQMIEPVLNMMQRMINNATPNVDYLKATVCIIVITVMNVYIIGSAAADIFVGCEDAPDLCRHKGIVTSTAANTKEHDELLAIHREARKNWWKFLEDIRHGDNNATLSGVMIIKVIDGGDAEDVYKALGESAYSALNEGSQAFILTLLKAIKEYNLSELECVNIFTMMPDRLVDDFDAQRLEIKNRIGLLINNKELMYDSKCLNRILEELDNILKLSFKD